MEPEIIDRDSFFALGLVNEILPEDQNEQVFQRIWREFETRLEEIRPFSLDGAFYGLSFSSDEAGTIEYLAGMATGPSQTIPSGLSLRQVPSSRYAVFSSPIQSIGETYRFVFAEWLPGSPYEISPVAPAFEQYPPEGEESSPVLIHIPIREVP